MLLFLLLFQLLLLEQQLSECTSVAFEEKIVAAVKHKLNVDSKVIQAAKLTGQERRQYLQTILSQCYVGINFDFNNDKEAKIANEKGNKRKQFVSRPSRPI
ncbi:hypothetical protein BpHYR1_009201 [Brachionus plicatilis]|uniref:Uncharacterized protein n=1 Tax=Brachionus plicatilis TaxID=10195 RepID=A0A3M7PD66_BRAPC|nr:hypothetical protein BpHYR1_009201 [Brachionus plicatilis]